jgi:hypothetical protein
MYFVGLLIKVGSFWLASQLELARYTTEQNPKLRSFKNSNEPSRVELLTSEFASFEFFRPTLHACNRFSCTFSAREGRNDGGQCYQRWVAGQLAATVSLRESYRHASLLHHRTVCSL